ncbi:hypothetical protein BN946_scf184909.g80, partial [Trametes cinnabarina]
MADRAKDRIEGTRTRSWIGKFGASSKDKEPALPAPIEGKEQSYERVPSSPLPSGPAAPPSSTGSILPFKRSNSGQSLVSLVSPRPTTPLSSKKRSNSSTSLTHDDFAIQQNALERTLSSQSQPATSSSRQSDEPSRGTFPKISLSSMLSSLTLSRSSGGSNDDERRGRSERKEDKGKHRSASFSGAAGAGSDRESSVSSRTRSQSPFRLRRLRTRERDPSPTVGALAQSDVESENEDIRRPESGDETEEALDSGSEESWSSGEQELDDITDAEHRRARADSASGTAEQDMPDYLGEGVNVIMPPEPYFPTTLNGGHGRNPRRRKSTKPHDTMALVTSRPVFQRDRCSITVTHGDPERVRQETGKLGKRYVLASDLSEESRYALEWGIGTVLRDGDELIIITVVENESKSTLSVDPVIPNPADRATKLRAQQEVRKDDALHYLSRTPDESHLTASSVGVYPRAPGDKPAAAHASECFHPVSSMACQEQQTYDPHRRLCRARDAHRRLPRSG